MKIKLCPFCGGEAKKQATEVNGIRAIYVVCEKCGASSGIYRTRKPRVKDEENPAIEAWNRREPIDKVVEQLERLQNVNSDYWNPSDLIDREDAIDIVKKGGVE